MKGEALLMAYTPQKYKIVSGIGKSIYPLSAFDDALIDAGIGDYNIVKVSSILPAKCVSSQTIDMPKGSILYAAYSSIILKNDEHGKAAVAIAIPESKNENGVIFECSSFEETDEPKDKMLRMCEVAMKKRKKEISKFEYSIKEAKGENKAYTVALAAVVMW